MEIGGNDFSYLFFRKRRLAEIQTLVQPVIIDAIAFAINMVIEYGARKILVAGNLRIGCASAYLKIYESPMRKTTNFNGLLKRKLDELRDQRPNATITVVEYGGRTIPIGCLRVYLTLLKRHNEEDCYLQTGCLRYLNEFSENHNRLPKRKLDGPRALHSAANILYAESQESHFGGWDEKCQNPFFVAGFGNGEEVCSDE
ncbi:hypothetical protein ACLOJK_010477 [Asimina triloba]